MDMHVCASSSSTTASSSPPPSSNAVLQERSDTSNEKFLHLRVIGNDLRHTVRICDGRPLVFSSRYSGQHDAAFDFHSLVFHCVKALVKDIIIRRGESIINSRIAEVAVICLPDTRLGELVTAVISVKQAFKGKVTEQHVLALARKTFVPFFLFSEGVMYSEPLQPPEIFHPSNAFELTPSSKIDNGNLRTLAQQEWEKPNDLAA
ncbi:hypothetical protein EDD85DRAFT_784145 [Armillaria nabsnona]|nr:hypothetical protein EDD85DRAFT_784145 [Armillaria nabsnona]